MAFMQQAFSANVTLWCSRNDTHIFTSVILYMIIIFIAQWLFGGNSEILHASDVFEHRHKLCKPESIFKQTRVNLYRENMTSFLNYITATLRALLHCAAHVTMYHFGKSARMANDRYSLTFYQISQNGLAWIALIFVLHQFLCFLDGVYPQIPMPNSR